MKKIFFILFLIFTSLPGFSYDYAKDGFQPLLTALSYSKISQAEQTILGQTYETQNINIRLNRLEQTLFNRTYPKMPYEQRVNNIIMNYNNNKSFSGLSHLEHKIFNQNFINDTPETRIARLEEEIMGTIQHGDLLTRYKNLRHIAPTYLSNRVSKQYKGLPVVQSGGGWRGLAGSLGNFFNSMNGYPTGYTPPIYSPYNNNYPPDFQQSYYSNHGWSYHNNNYGNGSGVHILD